MLDQMRLISAYIDESLHLGQPCTAVVVDGHLAYAERGTLHALLYRFDPFYLDGETNRWDQDTEIELSLADLEDA